LIRFFWTLKVKNLGLFGGNFPDLEEADPSQAAKNYLI